MRIVIASLFPAMLSGYVVARAFVAIPMFPAILRCLAVVVFVPQMLNPEDSDLRVRPLSDGLAMFY